MDNPALFSSVKPAPDIFLAAARLQGADSNDCIVFEDSIEGAEAASRAQMKFVIIGDSAPKGNNLLKFRLGRFKDFNEINVNQFVENLRNKLSSRLIS